MAVVFDGILFKFSPLFRLQPAAEHKLITSLPCGDKLEVGGRYVYGVMQLMCQFQQSLISVTDGRTGG